jgi:hypothetical protein
MDDHALQREVDDNLRAGLGEGTSAQRYRRHLIAATNGAMETNHARPLEFDEKGFPIPQRPSSFARRIARLLGPD